MQHHKTRMAIFFLTVLGVALCSAGFAEDNNKIISKDASGFYYTIKKGDTLWDLSEKFYHSQWDWPGLWQINDDLKNPHQIYPGKKIQIFLKGNPALKPKIAAVRKPEKEAAAVKIEPAFSYSEVDHIGFLKKTAQPSLGSIIKEQDGHLMMSDNDILYIKPSGNGTLVPGRIYHIFTTSPVEKKINHQTFKAVKHLIKAKIKILDHKKSYVTGRITHAYRTVYTGDAIMEYYERNSILTVEADPDPIDARIICSEDNNVMINDYRIAFMNAGKSKVKPGQIYSILRKNEFMDQTVWPPKKSKTVIQLENLESGRLIVLHTEDIASTIMILSSKYAIQPDDIIN